MLFESPPPTALALKPLNYCVEKILPLLLDALNLSLFHGAEAATRGAILVVVFQSCGARIWLVKASIFGKFPWRILVLGLLILMENQ